MSKEEVQKLLSRAVRGDVEATAELVWLDSALGRKSLIELLERDDVWSPVKRVECKYDAKTPRIPCAWNRGESRLQRQHRLDMVAA
jgi:hypothetical protein